MFNFRFLVIFAGSVLASLGLIIGFSATANLLSDAKDNFSPLDQVDDASQPDKGFIPMLAATEDAGGPPSLADAVQLPSSVHAPERPALPLRPAVSPTPEPVWIPDRILIPAIQL